MQAWLSWCLQMLHSIATGNMLPANVKVIVIDINQPTVTKLMDRRNMAGIRNCI